MKKILFLLFFPVTIFAQSKIIINGGASTAPGATVGGTGTTDVIPIWINSTTLGNSTITKSGTKLTVGDTLITKFPVTDIRAFGAVGDGVTDNTTAIQNAITASYNIYIPAGIFITSNLTIDTNRHIYGNGTTSVLKFKTGSTGFMLTAGTNTLIMENISLDGGSNVLRADSTNSGSRNGLFISQLAKNSSITGCNIYGFDSTGIALNGDGVLVLSVVTVPPTFSRNNIYNNFIGINTGRGLVTSGDGWLGGEYLKITNNNINYNRYGIRMAAGNCMINNNGINRNGYGVIFIAVQNDTHGTLNCNIINHNKVYGVYAKNTSTGMSIIGNQSWFGDWYFENCSGFNIQANNFDGSNVFTLTGGNTNIMKGNWFSSVPTINRTSDKFIFSDNVYGLTITYALGLRDLVALSGSATLNFGSTAAQTSADLTITVTGAAVGDQVSLGLPAAPDANGSFTAWVSATNTVTVRFNNYSAGAIDPASATYTISVIKQ